MKLHLPLALLVALVACPSIAGAASSILASGVVLDSKGAVSADSALFFDMGKGRYSWATGSKALAGAETLWTSAGKHAYLGELQAYLLSPEKDANKFNPVAFGYMPGYGETGLMDDANHCWAYTAANMIQYWQSTYGVFYKGSTTASVKHGYTYDKGNITTLGGGQSLDVGMLFYDNWKNTTGTIGTALSWYMDGKGTSTKTGASAGYFKEYSSTFSTGGDAFLLGYDGASVNCRYMSGGWYSSSEMASYLAGMLGYKLENNVATKLADGHIAGMSISFDVGGGHGLTIYGMETDSQGNLISLRIADSDDGAYALTTLYVQQVGNDFKLFTDEACEQAYMGGAKITELTGIQMSDTLIAMRAEYDSNTLVWTGGTTEWAKASADAEAEALPTLASGWSVDVGGVDYYSYFQGGRDVVFNDEAANTTVALGSDVSVKGMTIDNSTKDYSFSGAHTITAESFTKEGSSSASFTGTTLAVSGAAEVKGGTLSFTGTSKLQAATVTVNGGSLSVAKKVNLAVGSNAVEVKSKSGAAAYTLDLSAANSAVFNVRLSSTEKGGKLGGTVSYASLDVADGTILDLDSAILNFVSIQSQSGASLSVNASTIWIDVSTASVDSGAYLASGTMLYGDAAGEPVVLGRDASVYTITSGMLQNLSVSGSKLTLGFADVSDPYSSVFSTEHDFMAVSFAGNTSFDDLVGLDIVGKEFATHQILEAYYLQPLDSEGVTTIYFALGDIPTQAVPEPATATLSLLALAALAARRRRK